jgi:Cytochrome P450
MVLCKYFEDEKVGLFSHGINEITSPGTMYFPRVLTIITVGTGRTVMKQYTFSNGVTIPIGARVYSPLNAIHRDSRIYENADEFHGFRFLGRNDSEDQTSLAASTSPEYLQFGHGSHAWYTHDRSYLTLVPADFSPSRR